MVVVRLGGKRTLNDHPEFYPEFISRIMAANVNERSAGSVVRSKSATGDKQSR